MVGRIYSQHLGLISDEQFQAALDRFQLGRLILAEPIPFGLFGQNVFISSTQGEFVLRGKPHFWWQFPTEQYYARFLHERAHTPAPWPYLVDSSSDIFGWSYALMPRMPGIQLADPEIREQLSSSDRLAIARTLGENLAYIQKTKWPICGRYQVATDSVEPFELTQELAWPFPVESDPHLATLLPTPISYAPRVEACLRNLLRRAQVVNGSATTQEDIMWAENYIEEAQDALNEAFEPCFVLEDYKRENLIFQDFVAKITM